MSTSFYVPRFEVRVSGTTLAAAVTSQVTNVTYDNSADVADMFSVSLRNPNHLFTDSPLFSLGKTVEIHMGYGDELRPMMLGEITGIQPSFPQSGAPTLTVSGYDRSHRLRHNQPDRVYTAMTDTLIAAQIAVENGLIPVVDPSPFYWRRIPHTGSDIAFLKERARANFFEVFVHWDKLYFRCPRPQTEAFVLEWGKNLASFSPRLSSAGTAGLQVVRGYSEALAQDIVAFAMAVDLDLDHLVERLGSSAIDLLATMGRRIVRDQPIQSPIDAAMLARSMLQDILQGMYEASGTCIGLPDLRAGSMVSIRGLGKRFSGMYRLTKVTHSIGEGGYQTSFEVTQRAGTNIMQLLRRQLQETPSPTQRERFHGVTVGRVTRNVDTEEGRGRVQLQLPHFSNEDSPWARCVTPMAGDDRGMYFLPDVGDEVLVAFEHGDVAKPVVLGSMWNGVKRPPETHTDGQNRIRMIRTGAGHTITLDDTKGNEQVVVRDKGGSTIRLKVNGDLEIEAARNLVLNAPKGDIEMSSNNVRVSVKGTMDVS